MYRDWSPIRIGIALGVMGLSSAMYLLVKGDQNGALSTWGVALVSAVALALIVARRWHITIERERAYLRQQFHAERHALSVGAQSGIPLSRA